MGLVRQHALCTCRIARHARSRKPPLPQATAAADVRHPGGPGSKHHHALVQALALPSSATSELMSGFGPVNAHTYTNIYVHTSPHLRVGLRHEQQDVGRKLVKARQSGGVRNLQWVPQWDAAVQGIENECPPYPHP